MNSKKRDRIGNQDSYLHFDAVDCGSNISDSLPKNSVQCTSYLQNPSDEHLCDTEGSLRAQVEEDVLSSTPPV